MLTNVFCSSTLKSIVKPGGLNKIELIILFVSVLLIFIVELIEEHNINIREKLDKKIFIVRWIVYLFLTKAIMFVWLVILKLTIPNIVLHKESFGKKLVAGDFIVIQSTKVFFQEGLAQLFFR